MRLRVTRSRRPAGDRVDDDHGRRAADRDDRRPVGGGDVGRRRHDQLRRLRDATAPARRCPPSRADAGRCACATARATDATVCHTHAIQDYVGVASGHFVAPDHEYPSHLQLSLTATDAAGLSTTKTMRLNPKTASVTLASAPSGLQLSLRERDAGHAVHPHRDRALGDVGERAVAAAAGGRAVPVARLERRAGGGARDHRPGERDRHLHRDLRRDAGDRRRAGRDRPDRRRTPRRRRPAPARSSASSPTARASRAPCGSTSTPASEASELDLALYSEGQWEEPAALLATGHNGNPLAGGWNAVELGTGRRARRRPAVLDRPAQPARTPPARCAGAIAPATSATAERVSLSTTLSAFPASWASSASWWDGPLSASVWGTTPA